MRVTVAHNKGQQAAMQTVNQYSDELLSSTAAAPVQITDVQKRWDGPNMYFSFVGRMGIFSAPLKGVINVTEKDVTIDVDLPGILKQFVPEEKIKTQIQSRVKGLLT